MDRYTNHLAGKTALVYILNVRVCMYFRFTWSLALGMYFMGNNLFLSDLLITFYILFVNHLSKPYLKSRILTQHLQDITEFFIYSPFISFAPKLYNINSLFSIYLSHCLTFKKKKNQYATVYTKRMLCLHTHST